MSRIFISYRRDLDGASAGRLYEHLSPRFGQDRLFIDVDSIDFGEDFVEVLDRRLEETAVLLALISRRWLDCQDEHGAIRLHNPDDFVRLELATALSRGVRVIPILIDGAPLPRSEQLPDDLKGLVRRQACKINNAEFRKDVTPLADSLERLLTDARTKLRPTDVTDAEARQTEQERLAREATEKKAEDERIAREAAALKAERDRVVQAAALKAEQERLAREAAEKKAEEERIARVSAALQAERERLTQAALKAEQERLTREAAAQKAEQERLAREAAARKADEERVASEAAARQARIAREVAVWKAEQDRIAREAAAKAEQERLAREAAARAEQERLAREEAARKADPRRLAREAMAGAQTAARPQAGRPVNKKEIEGFLASFLSALGIQDLSASQVLTAAERDFDALWSAYIRIEAAGSRLGIRPTDLRDFRIAMASMNASYRKELAEWMAFPAAERKLRLEPELPFWVVE
jgi:hypothetical protein